MQIMAPDNIDGLIQDRSTHTRILQWCMQYHVILDKKTVLDLDIDM